jgi:hypothetical protein
MFLYNRRVIGFSKDQIKDFEKVQKIVQNKAKKPDYDEDYTDIRLMLSSEMEMYSRFSFASRQRINREIMDYIEDQVRNIPLYQPLKIVVKYVSGKAERNLNILEQMYRRYVMHKMIDLEHDLRRNRRLIIIMLVFGLVSLAILYAITNIIDLFPVTQLLIIVSWVFIWKAAEGYFFDRKILLDRKFKFIQLYLAIFEEEK